MNHLNANTQFSWLLLIAFVVALLAKRLRVPYALALVVTGLAIGTARLFPQAHLEPELLFTVFLPPLLFESALHLHLDSLRRNWKPIAIYTLAGTFGSTFIVGYLVASLLAIPLASALVFGALISATDPISVIAIFKKLGAGRRLTLIMEAESLFNDGVAVVLFSVLSAAALGASATLGSGALQFGKLVIGGVVLGALIGAVASRMHRDLDDHQVEIMLTSLAAFGSYLAAEALHVSGVMAVVAAGLVIGNFGQNVMTPGIRLAVTAFWEYAGFVVNSLVFLLIGIEVVAIGWRDKIGIALGAALLVLLGRSVIYPLSLLVNRIGGEVPRAYQHVLVWGGLRGALSMALVLGLPIRFPARETLRGGDLRRGDFLAVGARFDNRAAFKSFEIGRKRGANSQRGATPEQPDHGDFSGVGLFG
ncbi:monovalent cation:H+ antiporter, CPA1 family [Abditibacterium utsteinense]|uniref:Monovalent cation:H+ antiporter, CPA1 family n=1 Tax=Abditibacterium utsteinense TaxID=1960156 RepID=A0A2S8SPS4_9BACT|nr:cation:proton antiporter [Abditibacterium utsteinense]PQV62791.1 monovalent cation:H+ antiporter, CPA1 family [Abditibacterium utsteinense]